VNYYAAMDILTLFNAISVSPFTQEDGRYWIEAENLNKEIERAEIEEKRSRFD